jgi:hypothetical protein
MASWPYAPYCHMATNMANMGVSGTSDKNMAFHGENETNLSMLPKVIAKIVLSQKILCIFGKIPLCNEIAWPRHIYADQILKFFVLVLHILTQPWMNCQMKFLIFKIPRTPYCLAPINPAEVINNVLEP